MTFRFTRPIWEGRFGTSANWDTLWETTPRFRHIWRSSTVMWGVATLVDAALRVVIAYTLPVASVPAAQTGLIIVTMLLMQVVTNVYYLRVDFGHCCTVPQMSVAPRRVVFDCRSTRTIPSRIRRVTTDRYTHISVGAPPTVPIGSSTLTQ